MYRSAFSIPHSLSLINLTDFMSNTFIRLKMWARARSCPFAMYVSVFSKRLCLVSYIVYIWFRCCWFFSCHFSFSNVFHRPNWYWRVESDENWHFLSDRQRKNKPFSQAKTKSSTGESVNFEWHCTSIFLFIYLFIVASTTACPS